MSGRERTRRYRDRIDSDPQRKEAILAERRRKYQQKKAEGKLCAFDIKAIPKRKQEHLRKIWKESKKRCRAREQALNAILDTTPQSPENILVEPAHHPVEPVVVAAEPSEEPGPSLHPVVLRNVENVHSTPQATPTKWKKRTKRMKGKLARLLKENEMLKKCIKTEERKSMKFRKQLHRLTVQKEPTQFRERVYKPKQKRSVTAKRQEVESFLSRDENSRLQPGKKDTVGRLIKMQRRILTKSLQDIYADYCKDPGRKHSMSYRQFVRYRPFYITEAKTTDRNTCACYQHENMRLLIDRMAHRGIIPTRSLSTLLKTITCSPENKECMDRTCTKCCFEEIPLGEHNPLDAATWEHWTKEEVAVGDKMYKNWVKKTKSGSVEQLIEEFRHELESIASHQYNWIHQAQKFREMKEKVAENELVLHIDFSENYACKLNAEIQAFHFGGNRQQVTLHTAVAYTTHLTQSYATLSPSLRHDERAVWAHIKPLLEEVRSEHQHIDTLHVISDGPVTQYRNKTNCFLLSQVPFTMGFKRVTWNYSERSHGKGAPDGVGGAVKRMADMHVASGNDLQSPRDVYNFLSSKEETTVKFRWIEESDIEIYDKMLPSSVQPVTGILSTHQVLSPSPGVILYRDLSCFCEFPNECACYNPKRMDFGDVCQIERNNSFEKEDEYTVGKFVAVEYEGKPYVGQIVEIHGKELKINCMVQKSGNSFVWPQKPDCIYYSRQDVFGVISEPEPMRRSARLTDVDWLMFSLI